MTVASKTLNMILAVLVLCIALHSSGHAAVLTHECPHGLVDEGMCHVSLGQILDIQLTLYEAMMRHALGKKEP